MGRSILYEDVSSIMKLYQSDFEETPQSKDLDKQNANPLVKFKSVDIPTDSDELMKLKDVNLPDFLKSGNLIDKDKAEKVSNFLY